MIDLESLSAWLDDQALVRKYLDQFASDMPVLLQQMQTATANAQWDQLQLLAHTYKSQLQYINATSAIPIAVALEHINSEDLPASQDIMEMVAQLHHHLQDVLAEIERING